MFAEFIAFAKEKESTLSQHDLSVSNIIKYFSAATAYERVLAKHAFRQKFNGSLVTRLTGFTGVSLGELIKQFMSTYTKEEVVEMSDETISMEIMHCIGV